MGNTFYECVDKIKILKCYVPSGLFLCPSELGTPEFIFLNETNQKNLEVCKSLDPGSWLQGMMNQQETSARFKGK